MPSLSTATARHLGLASTVLDRTAVDHAAQRFAREGIVLPTFAQLADPSTIPTDVTARLADVDPAAADPANLFRCHWHNHLGERLPATAPDHVMLPESFTGVAAPIVVLFGDRFPMIDAHKVLAAYACLAARVATGQFDPTTNRAIWPSTGNYARGGVAISRIMGCRGVAVLPENMSRERFDWLDRWVVEPSDIIRTPGSESNVKEIYDKCAELAADPGNVVLNQFCEFANYLVHRTVTGAAFERVIEHFRTHRPELSPAAFVSATGSAGTIGAGDHLKALYGTKIVAVEALECPTMLRNGFGEHNIQGIGDKHIPLIHNVMNTDLVVGISDRSTDELGVAFASDEGRALLAERGVPERLIEALPHFGLSSICNVLAAIATARRLDLGPNEVVLTVATDGAQLYGSERESTLAGRYLSGYRPVDAAEALGRHLDGTSTAEVQELDREGRDRIFNLGYFTWVEQQGVELDVFEARRHQSFWDDLLPFVPVWDDLIVELNAASASVQV
jgi:cysteine synthase